MTRELKHCPFCGNAAAWCDEHHKDEPHECHHIVCTACNAQFDMSGSYNPETLAELKDYCGKRFNTRTEQASQSQTLQQENERLAKAFEEVCEERDHWHSRALISEQASQPHVSSHVMNIQGEYVLREIYGIKGSNEELQEIAAHIYQSMIAAIK